MGRKSISESISLILAGVLIGLAAGAVQATAVEPVSAMIVGARIGSATAHSSPQHLGLWEESHAPPDRSPPEKEIVFDPSYSQLI